MISLTNNEALAFVAALLAAGYVVGLLLRLLKER
jgi:hypothetical protein